MIYLVLALLLYTAAALFGAAAARHTNTNLASAISNTVSALVPILVILPAVAKKTIHPQKIGVIMAILSGIAVGLFVMALNKSFTQNKIGVVLPVVFGGSIVLSAILSFFIFKERITLTEGIGLVLVLSGLTVILYARAVGGS